MSGFGELAKKLAKLAEIPHEVAKKSAEEIKKLVDSEFSSGSDPYGRPWKSIKKGGPSRLSESGALRDSLEVEANGTEIKIIFSDYKFAFHQATRPILTVGTMPQSWSKAIETAFIESLKK